MRKSRRYSVTPAEGGETWYECIEEAVGIAVDYPRFSIHAAVPLLYGTESNPDLPVVDAANKGTIKELRGQTVPKMEKEDRPEGVSNTNWSPATAADLNVRCGPDYPATGAKEPSEPALYECCGCDTAQAGIRIDAPIPRLGPLPAGGDGWSKDLGIPRCVVFNCQFPLQEGPKLFGEHPVEDAGTSVVAQFVATPEVLRVARLIVDAQAAGKDPPSASEEPTAPAVKLLQELFARGTLDLPKGAKTGFYASGALKSIGWIEDLEDLPLPKLLKPTIVRYNGKPMLLGCMGKMHRDQTGEWMCVDFDIRGTRWLSRSALVQLREKFRTVSVCCGFVIQGTADEELPEVVLACLRLHGMDIEHGTWIEDPNAPAGKRQRPAEV